MSAHGCFDALAWSLAYNATPGWHNFSQGYQDSVLMSLLHGTGRHQHWLIGDHKWAGMYVEFGFHLNDVKGTRQRPRLPRPPGSPRHLLPMELPPYGANSEILARRGWSGIRFDGDEVSAKVIPNLHLEFITPETVVHLFRKHGVQQTVDYVSIDIDSCDLWIFLALTEVYRPKLISIEYNSIYAFNESRTNVCGRPQEVVSLPFFQKQYGQFYSTGLYGHKLDGASLRAIHLAAARRGYSVIWVEPHLDVFLARNDLLCAGREVPLQAFAASAGIDTHPNEHLDAKALQQARSKWVVEYE